MLTVLLAATTLRTTFTIGSYVHVTGGWPVAAVSADGSRTAYFVNQELTVGDRTTGKFAKQRMAVERTLGLQVAFSPDGKTLAMGAARTVWFFDAASLREQRRVELPAINDWVSAMAWAPDGRTLAVAAGTYGHWWVHRIQPHRGAVQPTALDDLDLMPSSLAYVAGGRYLFADSMRKVLMDASGKLVFASGDWPIGPSYVDVASNGRDWRIFGAREGGWPMVGASQLDRNLDRPSFWSIRTDQSAVVSPEGKWMAYVNSDQSVSIQESGQSAVRHELGREAMELRISGEGRWLLVRQSSLYTAIPVGP